MYWNSQFPSCNYDYSIDVNTLYKLKTAYHGNLNIT